MASPNTYNLNKGISLIEIIIVISIIGFIISFGLIISLDSYRKYYFRSERTIIVSVLERARSRAMNNLYESPHGVCYISPNYVIFRGKTCTTGLGTNELLSANSSIADASNFSVTFPTIVFNQLGGTTTPAVLPPITVTDGISSANITINYEGRIDW